MNKKIFKIFDVRWKYLLHLFLILLTLFLSYFLGNAILNFQVGARIIKMLIWFFVILYLSDNVWERVLKI